MIKLPSTSMVCHTNPHEILIFPTKSNSNIEISTKFLGLIRQPKWGHLKELHAAIKLCSETLLYGVPSNFSLGVLQEVRILRNPNASYMLKYDAIELQFTCLVFSEQAYVYHGDSGGCAAFLVNANGQKALVKFQNSTYDLPPKSISILPDCKTVAFNTAKASINATNP